MSDDNFADLAIYLDDNGNVFADVYDRDSDEWTTPANPGPHALEAYRRLGRIILEQRWYEPSP